MRKGFGSILVRCLVVLTAALAPGFDFPRCFASDDVAAGGATGDELQFESVAGYFAPIGRPDDPGMAPLDEELPWDYRQALTVERGSGERLIDRTTDPTSWLMDIRFRQLWNWPVEATDPDTQTLEFRPTIPFVVWDHVNLLRVTVPYNLEGADGAGLGDVQIFDLIVFEETWGRWGIGPSVRLTPNSGSDGDTFRAGPAAGAVTKNEHWTVGFLTQNFLSDGASESRLQPILAYKFDDMWSVSIGESEFRYDWNDAMWTQIPLGVQVDRIFDAQGQKLQFFINPQYNFQRDSSNSGWTLFIGVTLLVPGA
jgi:hypothetical protein